MTSRIVRLYPTPSTELALKGLYLQQQVHELGKPEAPFVYANFVVSLDGRIALEEEKNGQAYVPKHLISPNDFRLFLELLAQADCLVTHGGYLRALAEQRLGDILQLSVTSDTRDLFEWRRHHHLSRYPAVVVASSSLDFPVPSSVKEHGQPFYIATGQAADHGRIAAWKRQGYEVIIAGKDKMVEGAPLVQKIRALGYKTLYLIAGPRMLDTMIRDGQLSRLYLTITHQVIGGESFHSLLPGPELGQSGYMRLQALYYDPTSPHGAGQWFAQFDSYNRISSPRGHLAIKSLSKP